MSDKVTCAIIIVTYNGEDFIERCLKPFSADGSNFPIIVVDNQSTDNTKPIIYQSFPAVHLIELQANYGFAVANNIGLQYVLDRWEVDCVCLFNQDVAIGQGTIQSLVHMLKAHPDFGVLSPLHYDEQGGLDKNFERYIHDGSATDQSRDQMGSQIVEVPFVNAAAWCIARRSLDLIGGFDTSLFRHYGEDDHYCQRLRYHGLKIGVVTSASIIHFRQHSHHATNRIFLLDKAFIRDLVGCADINISDQVADARYRARVTNYFLILAKSIVTLNWSKVRWLLTPDNRRKVFNQAAINQSRSINKTVGRHWLLSSDDNHFAPLSSEKLVR